MEDIFAKSGASDVFDLSDRDRYIIERALTSSEIQNKRTWIANIILIIALILSNGAWIYYESQWQVVDSTTVQQEVEQETEDGGDNTFIGGDAYGTTDSKNDNP